MVGHHCADRVALAVIALLAQQDQVGRLGLEHLRQGVARGADVGAGECVIAEVDRAVRAERDCLVQGACGGLGAHRHGDDLVDLDGPALANLHRSFDSVRVEWIQVPLTRAVKALRAGIDPLRDSGVRHLLDKTADLQVVPPIAWFVIRRT